ncbi:MAG: DUF4386 domain-containing protein, partial [Bacteroidota bacterium]
MNKNTYRFTGLLYLFVILFAGFSQAYVRGNIVVSQNASATANNIIENEDLFRLGLSLDLVAFILDAIISVLLYQIFKPVNQRMALVASVLRLIAHPAIGSLNLLNHYLAYQVLGGAEFLSVFDVAQLNALSLLFMETHRYGYLIAGGFFGLHCLLLGILIYRSNTIPNIFGGFLLGSAAGYLIETFGNFNMPGYEEYTALIVGVAAAIGEISLTLYLLIKGKKEDISGYGELLPS